MIKKTAMTAMLLRNALLGMLLVAGVPEMLHAQSSVPSSDAPALTLGGVLEGSLLGRQSYGFEISVPLGTSGKLMVGNRSSLGGGDRVKPLVNPFVRYGLGCKMCPSMLRPFVGGAFRVIGKQVDGFFGADFIVKPKWSVLAQMTVAQISSELHQVGNVGFQVGLLRRLAKP